MLKSQLTSQVKSLIEVSKIPAEMKETYLGILEYLPPNRIEKMIFLLKKEQLILSS
jgi:hypothetical protein